MYARRLASTTRGPARCNIPLTLNAAQLHCQYRFPGCPHATVSHTRVPERPDYVQNRHGHHAQVKVCMYYFLTDAGQQHACSLCVESALVLARFANAKVVPDDARQEAPSLERQTSYIFSLHPVKSISLFPGLQSALLYMHFRPSSCLSRARAGNAHFVDSSCRSISATIRMQKDVLCIL